MSTLTDNDVFIIQQNGVTKTVQNKNRSTLDPEKDVFLVQRLGVTHRIKAGDVGGGVVTGSIDTPVAVLTPLNGAGTNAGQPYQPLSTAITAVGAGGSVEYETDTIENVANPIQGMLFSIPWGSPSTIDVTAEFAAAGITGITGWSLYDGGAGNGAAIFDVLINNASIKSQFTDIVEYGNPYSSGYTYAAWAVGSENIYVQGSANTAATNGQYYCTTNLVDISEGSLKLNISQYDLPEYTVLVRDQNFNWWILSGNSVPAPPLRTVLTFPSATNFDKFEVGDRVQDGFIGTAQSGYPLQNCVSGVNSGAGTIPSYGSRITFYPNMPNATTVTIVYTCVDKGSNNIFVNGIGRSSPDSWVDYEDIIDVTGVGFNSISWESTSSSAYFEVKSMTVDGVTINQPVTKASTIISPPDVANKTITVEGGSWYALPPGDGTGDAGDGRYEPGQEWSSYVTGTPWSSDTTAAQAFNGDPNGGQGSLVWSCLAANGNTMTFKPPTTITATSQIRISACQFGTQSKLMLNGVDITNSVSLGVVASWVTLPSNTIDSVNGLSWECIDASTDDHRVSAIEVDGKILVDSSIPGGAGATVVSKTVTSEASLTFTDDTELANMVGPLSQVDENGDVKIPVTSTIESVGSNSSVIESTVPDPPIWLDYNGGVVVPNPQIMFDGTETKGLYCYGATTTEFIISLDSVGAKGGDTWTVVNSVADTRPAYVPFTYVFLDASKDELGGPVNLPDNTTKTETTATIPGNAKYIKYYIVVEAFSSNLNYYQTIFWMYKLNGVPVVLDLDGTVLTFDTPNPDLQFFKAGDLLQQTVPADANNTVTPAEASVSVFNAQNCFTGLIDTTGYFSTPNNGGAFRSVYYSFDNTPVELAFDETICVRMDRPTNGTKGKWNSFSTSSATYQATDFDTKPAGQSGVWVSLGGDQVAGDNVINLFTGYVSYIPQQTEYIMGAVAVIDTITKEVKRVLDNTMQVPVEVVDVNVRNNKMTVDGGDWYGYSADGRYEPSQEWSSLVTPTPKSEDPASNAFDGTTTGPGCIPIYPTDGGTGKATFSVPSITSGEVVITGFNAGTTPVALTINGVAQGTTSGYFTFTETISSSLVIEWFSADGFNYTRVDSISVGGELLVDSSVPGSGDVGDGRYEPAQEWSDSQLSPNTAPGFSVPLTALFNGYVSEALQRNDGSDWQWKPSTNIAFANSVSVWAWFTGQIISNLGEPDQVIVDVALGEVSLVEIVRGGSGVLKSLDFMGSGGSYPTAYGIEIDDKLLVDSSVPGGRGETKVTGQPLVASANDVEYLDGNTLGVSGVSGSWREGLRAQGAEVTASAPSPDSIQYTSANGDPLTTQFTGTDATLTTRTWTWRVSEAATGPWTDFATRIDLPGQDGATALVDRPTLEPNKFYQVKVRYDSNNAEYVSSIYNTFKTGFNS